MTVNFDFGKHWNTRIVPVIRSPEIVASIRRALEEFLPDHGFNGWKVWDESKPPVLYTSRDRTKEERTLAKAFVQAEKQLKAAQRREERDGYEPIDRALQTYIDAQYALLSDRERKERPWQDQIESYVAFFACHYWSRHFLITLAKMVEPTETWRVLKGPKHSTVINADGTKCFDIIYWALEGRLEHLLFGDAVREVDPSLGGNDAVRDAQAPSDEPAPAPTNTSDRRKRRLPRRRLDWQRSGPRRRKRS